MDREVRELRRALQDAAIRLEILTGRMRACHEETGKHELLEEAEDFAKQAKDSLIKFDTEWGKKNGLAHIRRP